MANVIKIRTKARGQYHNRRAPWECASKLVVLVS
jgi:hypothetical protein